MRELEYAVDQKAANLHTFAVDEPGSGGACHKYVVETSGPGFRTPLAIIKFQDGPINEGNGVNGVQNEDLIAIVMDRLRGFQSGKFACDDNAKALAHLEYALYRLQKRTRERIARGVEGTHAV